MHRQTPLGVRCSGIVAAGVVLAGSLVSPGIGSAADADLAGPLCEVLRELVPEVQGYRPEGAQAQLVIAIADRFDTDPEILRRVQQEIDAATTSACPGDRQAMLAVLKMPSLAEAVR